MKVCICLAIFMIFSVRASHAQTQPMDMVNLKASLLKEEGKAKYNSLSGRYLAFDSTLARDDYRYLYFGFVYQEEYSAYPQDKKHDIIAALKANNFSVAAKICDTVLDQYPFSLSANYYKGYAYFKLYPSTDSFIPYRERFKHLVDAIVSTGDGLTCGTGFKIIAVSDEYMVIYNYFNIQKFNGQALVGKCDKLTIEPSTDWKKNEIYFDAEAILNKEAELFKK